MYHHFDLMHRKYDFCFQQQLRHRWDVAENNCFVNICDAEFKYWFEYLGNSPRLVVTPLTDRCYITLTQSVLFIYIINNKTK